MNRGRRKNLLPPPVLLGKKIELEEIKQSPRDPLVWVVTLRINGWPHDVKLWAKDELDIFKQVKELQRGATNNVS